MNDSNAGDKRSKDYHEQSHDAADDQHVENEINLDDDSGELTDIDECEAGDSGDESAASQEIYREFIVTESADQMRIDLFLTQSCDGYSRTQIRAAVQDEGAQVNGRTVRPSFKLQAGQRLRFKVPPLPSDESIPENIPLDILYEDDGLVVVNKPAGMVVHPARGHWSGTLTSALAFRFQSLSDVGGPTRPGIVHRLDRDTSGVIVIAKTNAVHIHLGQQFHDREVKKEYFAITAGKLDRDRDIIEAPIGRHPYQRDKMAIRDGHVSSRDASTFYEVVGRHGRFTQVLLRPKTGRTHQIRVHLAHVGAPIICDRLYAGHSEITASTLGGKARMDGEPCMLDRQALHARSLTLVNPQSGKEMTFEAPIPGDMQRVIDYLNAQE